MSGPRRSNLIPDRRARSCAGQGCEERDVCARYLRKPAFAQAWASYDIERQNTGNCPAFERVRSGPADPGHQKRRSSE